MAPPANMSRALRSMPDRAQALRLTIAGEGAEAPQRTVARLLDALGIPWALDVAENGTDPASGARCTLQGPGRGAVDVDLWHVSGLPGVLTGRETGLRIDVLGVHAGDGRLEAGALADAMDLLGSSDAASDAELHLVVAADATDADTAALRATAARAGHQRIVCDTLADTLASLVDDPMRCAQIIAIEGDAQAVAATAAALAGTRKLTHRVRLQAAGTSTCIQSEGPSATIVALADLLHALGFHRTRERLRDAWLCTLEDGRCHRGLDHLAPYAHRLDDDIFLDAVIERLDRRPRHMPPTRRYADTTDTGPRLRLI